MVELKPPWLQPRNGEIVHGWVVKRWGFVSDVR